MKTVFLSKFKKHSSDNDTTILKHDDGHELKIAHKSLTPKMRKDIESLPNIAVKMAYAGEVGSKIEDYKNAPFAPTVNNNMAGAVGDQVSSAMDGDASVGVNDFTPPEDAPHPGDSLDQTVDQMMQRPESSPGILTSPYNPPTAAPAQPKLASDMPSAQASPGQAPQEDAPEAEAPQAPAAAAPVQQAHQRFAQEAHNFNQDVASGNITPETYKSLFNKQDTLGKIGTLFGLLVSGAGSGLAGQQNAVLNMMNQEIERDFDAQKTNKTNAQNFYRLNMQHELQGAQIPQIQANTAQTKAQTSQIPSEINLRNQQAASTKAEALTKMQQYTVANHFIGNLVNRMPPGMQAKAAPALNAVQQASQQEIGVLGQKYAGADQQEGGSSQILKPGASEAVTGAQFSHLPDADQLAKEYGESRQGEKGLAVVDSIFPKLSKEANLGEYLSGLIPKGRASDLATGAAGEALLRGGGAKAGLAALAGAGLLGAGMAGTAGLDVTQQNRLFNTNKTLLRGAVTSALRGLPISNDAVEQAVDNFTPEYKDSKEVLDTKSAGIKEFIKSHLQTGTLRRYKLAE